MGCEEEVRLLSLDVLPQPAVGDGVAQLCDEGEAYFGLVESWEECLLERAVGEHATPDPLVDPAVESAMQKIEDVDQLAVHLQLDKLLIDSLKHIEKEELNKKYR